MNFISDSDHAEFETRFASAAAFLRKASLKGELSYLKRNASTEWEKKRLCELEAWERSNHYN